MTAAALSIGCGNRVCAPAGAAPSGLCVAIVLVRAGGGSPAWRAPRRSTSVDTKGHRRRSRFSSASGTRSRASRCMTGLHGDWSLSPTFTGTRAAVALHGHRFGGVHADPRRTAVILAERRISALRADRARLPPCRTARADSRRSSSGRGGGRDLLSALVFGASTSMAWRSIRSSRAT